MNSIKVILKSKGAEVNGVVKQLEKPLFWSHKTQRKSLCKYSSALLKRKIMPIIQRKILEGSTIHTDGWKPYDDLIVNGYTHYLVFHHENEFVRGKSHVNGIESF